MDTFFLNIKHPLIYSQVGTVTEDSGILNICRLYLNASGDSYILLRNMLISLDTGIQPIRTGLPG